MSNLSQRKQKSDDISIYIKKQLSTLLKQVQQTPPKRNTSLKRISSIIQKSQIPKYDKEQISKSIKRVQSAIQRSTTVNKIKDKLSSSKIPKSTNKYENNLFFENMILQQKELNMKQKNMISKNKSQVLMNKSPKQFLQLISTFEELRTRRLKYEYQIQSLSIKAQKLQRLIQIKKQNQEKYLHSVQFSQRYHQKKQKLQQMKNQIKIAAKQNRKKIVTQLMRKYTQIQQN